jgi:hypothetical protein
LGAGMSFVVINLDLTVPDISVVPGYSTSGPAPFDVYVTFSDVNSTVFYTTNNQAPVVGSPGTRYSDIPFRLTFNTKGIYFFKYFIVDEAGNSSEIKTIRYIVVSTFELSTVTPRISYTTGNSKINIYGEGFNPNAVILIGGLAIKTEYVSNEHLIGTTLPMNTGSYDVIVNDPVNGLSNVLPGAFAYVQKEISERPVEETLAIGETRKNTFETESGTMVLTRKKINKFDIDSLMELKIKDGAINRYMLLTRGGMPTQVKAVK